jgi:hypothetical protein
MLRIRTLVFMLSVCTAASCAPSAAADPSYLTPPPAATCLPPDSQSVSFEGEVADAFGDPALRRALHLTDIAADTISLVQDQALCTRASVAADSLFRIVRPTVSPVYLFKADTFFAVTTQGVEHFTEVPLVFFTGHFQYLGLVRATWK